jgi:tetratricopeptide (TPR) repeat protein
VPVGKLALVLLAIGLSFRGLAGTTAQAQQPELEWPPLPEDAPDPFLAEIIRGRILARIGRTEEALEQFAALLAKRPDDRALREDYVELLLEAGFLERAEFAIATLLRDDRGSLRLRRLQARLDLELGRIRTSAERLERLLAEAPNDAGIAADLANAELRDGRWAKALGLLSAVLHADPDNLDARRVHREILVARSPVLEGFHTTLFQRAATQQTQEVAWRRWLSERLWLRLAGRHAIYVQDGVPGTEAFTEEVQTGIATLGAQWTPRLATRLSFEEARREDLWRTTVRLGATYDDGRATLAALDLSVREQLTNPVVAVPLRGAADRLTVDLTRRLDDRLTAGAHYSRRHPRVLGRTLGTDWEFAARAEIELLRGPLQLLVVPQVFFAEYVPTLGSPLRERIGFLRRQDILATGLLASLDALPGLRVRLGAVGRRDLHRAVTSWEVTGESEWRIREWLHVGVLYTRNTEGSQLGGKEESFTGRVVTRY